jgi:UDP-glucose 4-epimerase
MRDDMKAKSVIVFGGSGFLGSHVADALSEAGYSVTIFDKEISTFLQDNQEMVQGNILDVQAVEAAMTGKNVVFNFAGLADIDEAKDKPIETAELNIMGNLHMLEAAKKIGVKRFVFASSVYVYSDAGSFYRASKQSSERFVESYHERYGLDYTILRYGSLYGRRSDARNAMYRFIKEALNEHTITYKGNSDAMREYIHVQDAAQLSVKILEEEFSNRHIILTGRERLPVMKVMKMIAEMLPYDVKLQLSDEEIYGHYEMSPYAFHPKVGHKLVANDFVDLGQGILDCFADLHEKSHKASQGDWLVSDDEADSKL